MVCSLNVLVRTVSARHRLDLLVTVPRIMNFYLGFVPISVYVHLGSIIYSGI